MKDFFLSVIGFLVFIAFIVFSFWLGVTMIILVAISVVLLIVSIFVKRQIMLWKYGKVFRATDVENAPETYEHSKKNNIHISGNKTIIDVEYQEISDKK